LPCGTYKIDTAALHKALKFEKLHRLEKTEAGTILIRVFFHIFTYDDGSHPAATLDQIKSEFNTLVAAYAADNICFLNTGVNYFHSSFFDTGFNASTDSPSDFFPYEAPNCINVFYSIKINGNNSSCSSNCGIGGDAFYIPNTFCLIAKSNINAGQTIAHEVGHCMGLYHTFETGNGYEDIDGSNASTTADLIADTPADPYAYNNQSCYSTSGCTYNGSCKDPKNQSNFSPPYTNLMAYWWAVGSACYPSLTVTNNQYTRINSFLSTNQSLEDCESPANVDITNVNQTYGYYIQSAVNTLTTFNNVNISGNTISTLGGANIIINPGFHATPSDGGIVLVRIKQCDDGIFNITDRQKENSVTLSTKNNTAQNSIIAYPNPTNSIINLQLNLTHKEDKISVKVYDMNMKMMKEVSLENLLKGVNIAKLDLSNLSSGMYIITLQSEDILIRTLVVLQK
jgi:hypothetical protein